MKQLATICVVAGFILWGVSTVEAQPFGVSKGVAQPFTGGALSSDLSLPDNIDVVYGTGSDFETGYDSANTRWELRSSDTNGAGLDADIIRVTDGQASVMLVSGRVVLGTSGEYIEINSGTGVTTISVNNLKLGGSADAADSGQIRGLNGFSTVCAEANPAGTDGCITAGTTNVWTSNWAMTFSADDMGWSIVDQTDNQACTTGCTSACMFGIENATGTTVTGLVSCAATTADLCACAGAN